MKHQLVVISITGYLGMTWKNKMSNAHYQRGDFHLSVVHFQNVIFFPVMSPKDVHWLLSHILLYIVYFVLLTLDLIFFLT